MKGNILLVDDETVNLDVLSRRLGREGYLVNQAESGRKATSREIAIRPIQFFPTKQLWFIFRSSLWS